MSTNNSPRTTISQVTTPEEIGEFWNTHSLAEYWDETYEVEFEVRIQPQVPNPSVPPQNDA